MPVLIYCSVSDGRKEPPLAIPAWRQTVPDRYLVGILASTAISLFNPFQQDLKLPEIWATYWTLMQKHLPKCVPVCVHSVRNTRTILVPFQTQQIQGGSTILFIGLCKCETKVCLEMNNSSARRKTWTSNHYEINKYIYCSFLYRKLFSHTVQYKYLCLDLLSHQNINQFLVKLWSYCTQWRWCSLA
jgi:hypothetical protein